MNRSEHRHDHEKSVFTEIAEKVVQAILSAKKRKEKVNSR